MVHGVQNKKSGDIRKIQKLLGHNNLQTTEIYTHITSKAVKKIKKLLDDLEIRCPGNG